jgi:DNA adenine methylase
MNTFKTWCGETEQIKQEKFWSGLLGGTWINENDERKLSHDIVVGGVQIDIESVHKDSSLLNGDRDKFLSIPLRKLVSESSSKSRFFIKYDHRCDYGFVADLDAIRKNLWLNTSGNYQLIHTNKNRQRLSYIKNSGDHVKSTIISNTFYRILKEDIKSFKFVDHGGVNAIKNFIFDILCSKPKLSILRYPGGKFYHVDTIVNKFPKTSRLIEPFCGGATVAIRFAQRCDGDIWLNDLNPDVASFWKIVCGDAQKYDTFKKSLPCKMTLNKFYAAKNHVPTSILSRAVRFFILNKCSVLGITTEKSNPIGGKGQKSKWSVDWCWKKDKLCSNLDAIRNLLFGRTMVTCKSIFEMEWDIDDLIFCDPPYVGAGPGLYGQYGEFDHKQLAEKLIWINGSKTVITYDDNQIIHDLYAGYGKIDAISVQSQRKKSANKELIISLH